LIIKSKLFSRIEPFIYDKLDKEQYEFFEDKAIKLLTWNRLDLGFKLNYLELKDKVPNYAKDIYHQDIKSQTLGTFEEFGNKNKDSFEEYVKHFDTIYNNIKQNGFNSENSFVPLSDRNTIINGAHRVASLIYLEEKVKAVKLELPIMTCDYKYFFERNVPEYIIEAAVLKFIEYSENTFIAFLWPSGSHNLNESVTKFSKIIYKKSIKLDVKGAFNLLYHLYSHMSWVGNSENDYQGIKQKLIECFPTFSPFTMIAFQSNSIEDVKQIKSGVRSINNIGFSSIHITDTKEEAISISQLLLNENGLHYLTFGNPTKFLSVEHCLNKYINLIERNNIDKNSIVLDGSVVLALYGLRKNNDLDYISSVELKSLELTSNIDSHDDVLVYHQVDKQELIYNPKYYFYFKGIKIVSLKQVYHMKNCRGETKDIHDCKMMDAYISDNRLALSLIRIKQYYYYSKIKFKIRFKNVLFRFLKKLKLYNFVRMIFNYIKSYL